MKQSKATINIQGLSLEGDGVGRPAGSGKTAFVPYTVPDESVSARLLFEKPTYSRWIPLTVDRSSNDRVAPSCAHFFKSGSTRWCGGCDWQHLHKRRQEKEKETLVYETIERIGKIKNPPVRPILTSPSAWHYRNKVQIPFGRENKKNKAGFFHPGSHKIVDLTECPVQSDLSLKIFHFIKDLSLIYAWPVYNEDRHQGWLRHLLIRTNAKGQAMVTIVSAGVSFPKKNEFIRDMTRAFPSLIGLHHNVQKARSNVILGRHWNRLWGRDAIKEEMNGLVFATSPASFFQVNTAAAERLYEKAMQDADLSNRSILLDLYCGVGCMTLLGAKKTQYAFGVEQARSSIRDAKENARLNNVRNVEFIEAGAEAGLRSRKLTWVRDQIKNTVILLDPPRSGCSEGVLRELLAWRAPKLVYVSCHPATLARDLTILKKEYHIRSVTPVDLFPQTSHIETVTKLERQ